MSLRNRFRERFDRFIAPVSQAAYWRVMERERERREREQMVYIEQRRRELEALRNRVEGIGWRARDAARAEEERRRNEVEGIGWRAREVERAIEEGRRAEQRGKYDPFEIHRESQDIMSKVNTLERILKTDLGIQDLSKYDDIGKYLNDTIGNYIDTSPTFAANRDGMKKNFGKIVERISLAKGLNHQLMGLVTDFVFKHNLQDFFIEAFVKDCVEAYRNGHLSCVRGIEERFPIILMHTVVTLNGGVFDKLKIFFGVGMNLSKPWNDIPEQQQEFIKYSLSQSIEKWKKNYNANPGKYPNRASRRQGAYNYVLKNYKNEMGTNMPQSIKNYMEREYIPKNVNSFNAAYALEGGRKRNTRRRGKKSKRSKRTRKH